MFSKKAVKASSKVAKHTTGSPAVYWRGLNDRASAAGTFEVAKANIYAEAFPFGKFWNHVDCQVFQWHQKGKILYFLVTSIL